MAAPRSPGNRGRRRRAYPGWRGRAGVAAASAHRRGGRAAGLPCRLCARGLLCDSAAACQGTRSGQAFGGGELDQLHARLCEQFAGWRIVGRYPGRGFRVPANPVWGVGRAYRRAPHADSRRWDGGFGLTTEARRRRLAKGASVPQCLRGELAYRLIRVRRNCG